MKKTTINHRWMKFRLRTLLVFVALLAASFAFGPTLWQRHQRNHAIESAVSGDPDQIDSYSLLRSIADNSGRDHRDLDLVLEKLLQIVETGPDGERTKTAVIMIRELAARSGSVEMRERYLGDLIHELTNGSHAWSTEEQIVRTIAHWTPSTGLNQQQRLALLVSLIGLESATQDRVVPAGERSFSDRLLSIVRLISSLLVVASSWTR